MPFFAVPYRVLFHDTMAYGSHHFLTNFKFQNIARETILFESPVNGQDVWQKQLKDITVLTREAYSLNLAPVAVGQRVAILLSYEDPTHSTVRLCFRVIREDGVPVSCGYQTMLCMDKDGRQFVAAPPMVTQYLDANQKFCLIEKLTEPSFAERSRGGCGALKAIFDDGVIRVGKHIANARKADSHARIIGEDLREYTVNTNSPLPQPRKGIVFVFSGQGSYSPETLLALNEGFPETAAVFRFADEMVKELLGEEFLRTVVESSRHGRLYKIGIAQVGIYLADALIAKILMHRGLQPDLLLGHSFGELAAFAASEVYSIETGIELVCRRVQALRSARTDGQMAAVGCGAERTAELLNAIEPHSLEIAVINHPKQTVISGNPQDLERMTSLCGANGISVTRIESPFPFHSSHLAYAVQPFRSSLSAFSFAKARIPIYLCTEQKLYGPELDVADILSRQLIRRLDFASLVGDLRRAGYESFVECGSGDIVTKFISKNLHNESKVKALASAPSGRPLKAALDEVLKVFGAAGVERQDSKIAEKSVTEDVGRVLVKNEAKYTRASLKQPPIAIVGMGCVLPGAADVNQYWHNVKAGISGIVDLGMLDPGARRDFEAGSVDGEMKIVPDKTYSLLNGSIVQIPFDPSPLRGRFTEQEFRDLTRGQKMLSLAIGQALLGFSAGLPRPDRIQCVLGATGDGSSELDDAALVESLQDEIAGLDEPDGLKDAFAKALEQVCGRRRGDTHTLSQHRVYRQVVDRFVPGGAVTYVVDSACSSSLYAINLGVKALVATQADLVIVGGVFAPGPSNNPLFAQFRGLSAKASRPFDKNADGVIFGDGAAMLVLKRLPNALADGDRVFGVIRGMGLSSDGKSPSINVPQSRGQSLAIRRALSQADIPASTIQYVEAHATATPIGDKVEIASLREVFGNGAGGGKPIELASVKALIGHTGWVSGAASVIKVCKAMEERIIPRQYNYDSPDPLMGLEQTPFQISKDCHPWPENVEGCPRRAGVNGFGFGGTNAHLVLEQFVEDYHRRLCAEDFAGPKQERLCIVGVGSLFPSREELGEDRPSGVRIFDRRRVRLPEKKRLLPDVTEHMDASQFLVSLAAEQILKRLPPTWENLREEIGVVVGLESKTERGVSINKRILLDRVVRLFREGPECPLLSKGDALRIMGKLADRIRSSHLTSGPYTLPGLMPNVTASRVSSLYDLNGPNMVIDMGAGSLFQSLLASEQLLLNEDCKMVFVGGVNALNSSDPSLAETVFLLALTSVPFAEEWGFPVLAELQLDSPVPGDPGWKEIDAPSNGFDYRGATGSAEIRMALEAVSKNSVAVVRDRSGSALNARGVVVSPRRQERRSPTEGAPAAASKAYAYVQNTPIYTFTPALLPEPVLRSFVSLAERKLLVLCDQPARLGTLRSSCALEGLDYHVVSRVSAAGQSEIQLSFEAEPGLANSLRALDTVKFDTIVALQLADEDCSPHSFLEGPARNRMGLLELLFAVCRHAYDRLRDGQLVLSSLATGSISGGLLHPGTGLIAGFMKSLGRELPDAQLAIVNTDERDLRVALRQLEAELEHKPGGREVCYVDGRRHVVSLRRVEKLTRNNEPYLHQGSVVLATGGGRGVTAVLVEELLSRFGCTVVAAGRTDPDLLPGTFAGMTEDALRDCEAEFYKQELSRNPGLKIRELKRQFASYLAGKEVRGNVDHLQTLPGKFEYRCLDLNDAAEVDLLIDSIYQKHGRLDLVLHGAGIQVSGVLTKKSVSDFRTIVSTKLGALATIFQAVEKRRNGAPVHYHLLTSAFSYMGNDGQPDYGAANEALNRIAAAMDDPVRGVHWSSMAWLGWAGIGMTRGSEFAALAANRGLRGVTKAEGRKIFSALLSGAPATPINVLLSDGEIRYYGVAVEGPARKTCAVPESKREDVLNLQLTLEDAPFLRNHLVRDVPTLPASFLTCLVADAATKLRPHLKIVAYEDTRYHRFVKLPRDGCAKIRIHARVVSESHVGTAIHVRILSDFVHKSGRPLQTDILHNETTIRMAESLANPPKRLFDSDHIDGIRLPDPYLLPDSKVRLNGPFASTRNIAVGRSQRVAQYHLANCRYPQSPFIHMLPNMIFVDAFWRFGTVHEIADHTLGVYVPERCGVMRVYFDYMAFDAPALTDAMTFRGFNPRAEGDVLHVGPIEVSDREGKVMLVVEQGLCRKLGEVQRAS